MQIVTSASNGNFSNSFLSLYPQYRTIAQTKSGPQNETINARACEKRKMGGTIDELDCQHFGLCGASSWAPSWRRKRWPQGHPPTISPAAADRLHAGGMPLTSLGWHPIHNLPCGRDGLG